MKYALLTAQADGENNIGIFTEDFDKERLEKALSEHFDEDVIVKNIKRLCQFTLEFELICEFKEEKREFIAELTETWLY